MFLGQAYDPPALVAFKKGKVCGRCKSEMIFKLNEMLPFDTEGVLSL